MQEASKKAWAGAYRNDDFFCIENFSGYGRGCVEPKGKWHLLEREVSDGALGEALLKALENSRFLLPEEDPELFDLQLTVERCHAWVADSGKQYHYKTQHAIFENMQSCGINKVSGCITIKPRRQEKLGRWSSRGISEEAYIALPESSSAAELGAALRLAFSRCR